MPNQRVTVGSKLRSNAAENARMQLRGFVENKLKNESLRGIGQREHEANA